MPSLNKDQAEPEYWRSLDELADTPQFRKFVEREFPGLASAMYSGKSRRQFLKLMGASFALAGLSSCRWPPEKFAPGATSQPAGRTPGEAVQYATAMELGGYAQGLLVKCYDGRPIKVEGNPLHPTNRGAANTWAQASVLEVFDPDRSREPLLRDPSTGGNQAARTWDDFAAFAKRHFPSLKEQRGMGLYVLTEATSSPSMADMQARVTAAFPGVQWCEYEPISRDNERAAMSMVFGRPYRPQLLLDRARVILSLDDDLFGSHPIAIQYARDFMVGRRVDSQGQRLDGQGPMSRLFVVESGYTATGAMADERHAVRASQIAVVAACLAAELREMRVSLPLPAIPPSVKTVLPAQMQPFIRAVAAELMANRGRGVITVGHRQPDFVHALAAAMNLGLGNFGNTIWHTAESDRELLRNIWGLGFLAKQMQEGKVDTLLILGGNPVFDAPADFGFVQQLASVKTAVHLSLYNNETSQACTWHLPRAHFLESWGDARAYDGTLSIIQPTIEPLYGGRTSLELLAQVCGDQLTKGQEIVRRTFNALPGLGVDRDGVWRQSLHDGVVADSVLPRSELSQFRSNTMEAFNLGFALLEHSLNLQGPEVSFMPDYHVYDGRFANSAWLQEQPDPLTKLTWDNAALIAPATAEQLGIRTGDVIKLTVTDATMEEIAIWPTPSDTEEPVSAGLELEIAAFVQPGHAEGQVTLPVGYGRRAAGRVGNGVGTDVYPLRTSEGLYILTGIKIEKTGRRHEFATTQDHQAIDSKVGRREKARRLGQLVREATLAEYLAEPDFARHVVEHPPLKALWQQPARREGEKARPPAHRWAMAIDLNACVGCGACAVACQAENNIPVVGKDEVARGREMAWLRVDRYFKGDPKRPQVAFQPVTCHHCEDAPCEQVCPFAATMHSGEGLNEMVYNRCVGTRYCSNNCPYKVRRFNWFNNHKNVSEVEKLAFNPEVTVRSRGVMEKCSYCVQRIAAVKIAAKNERRRIADGEITPACAQTCPTNAIVFGDLNDPDSRVCRLQAADRAYAMLAELNIKPRTMYLARLRNPRA